MKNKSIIILFMINLFNLIFCYVLNIHKDQQEFLNITSNESLLFLIISLICFLVSLNQLKNLNINL